MRKMGRTSKPTTDLLHEFLLRKAHLCIVLHRPLLRKRPSGHQVVAGDYTLAQLKCSLPGTAANIRLHRRTCVHLKNIWRVRLSAFTPWQPVV